MTGFGKKRFKKLKETYSRGVLLLRDNHDTLWTYFDDAINLADWEGKEAFLDKKKGEPFFTFPEYDLDKYYYEEIEDEEGAYYIPYADEPTLPDSALLEAELMQENMTFTMLVVEDPADRNPSENIYDKSDGLSAALLQADVMGKSDFDYKGDHYSVVSINRMPAYETFLLKKHPFLDLHSTPQTIYIYKNITFTKEHGLKQITALVLFSGQKQPIKVNVYYSADKDEYFLSLEVLNLYRAKYGLPFIKAEEAPGETIFGPLPLPEESIFRLNGYTVAEKAGLTANQRQEILMNMNDLRIVTKADTLNYLSAMISLGEKNPSMIRAVEKWREDLMFISEYNTSGLPEIWSDSVVFKFKTVMK